MARESEENRDLTPEELDAEDVSQLPNREAMSVIATAEPLPIWSDPQPVPPGTDPPEYGASDVVPKEDTSYIGPPVASTDA